MLNKYIKCNFGGWQCGTSTIVDVRRLKVKQEQIAVWLCLSQVADQDTLSLAITKSWFEQLAPNPMELVVSVCRQPFTELRLAGLQVLRVLAEQQWGQENMNSMPGE